MRNVFLLSGASSTTNFALTTDNYGVYYPQGEQPGRLTTSGVSIDNDLTGPDFVPNGSNHESTWSETKFTNKNYNIPNQNNNQKEFKYVPRKERYRNIYRRSTPKPKKSSTYPEMVINGRNVEGITLLTTAETNTERSENRIEIEESVPVRAKRWFGEGQVHKLERSM